MVWKRFSDGGECKWWLVNKLQECGYEVQPDWIPYGGEKAGDEWIHYSPRVDVALGPFDPTGGSEKILEVAQEDKFPCLIKDYTDAVNPHPNCLIAIEIGYVGSRKHRMGDLVNASLLGHVGLVIAKDERTEKSYQNIAEYLEHYNKLHAFPFGLCTNVLIMTVNEVADILAGIKRRS